MAATPCIIYRDGKRFTRAPSITKALDMLSRMAETYRGEEWIARRERDDSLVYCIKYGRTKKDPSYGFSHTVLTQIVEKT